MMIKKFNIIKNTLNILNKLIKSRKQKYFSMNFEENKYNLKNTWKLIGKLVNRKTKGQIRPSKLIRNGQTVSDVRDIAEEFNSFFY